MTMEKQYLVDWDVWNVQTQTYEPEGLCDWAYAESEEEAINLMMDYIIENSDDWDIDREGEVLKLSHEYHDSANRLFAQNLEYRNFHIHITD